MDTTSSQFTIGPSQYHTHNNVDSPQIPIRNINVRSVMPVSGTSVSLNLKTANCVTFTILVSGNTTFTISNPSVGQVFTVLAQQGNGTTYTITWPASIKWVTSGASAPTLTTTSNGYTWYGLQYLGSAGYFGCLISTQ